MPSEISATFNPVISYYCLSQKGSMMYRLACSLMEDKHQAAVFKQTEHAA